MCTMRKRNEKEGMAAHGCSAYHSIIANPREPRGKDRLRLSSHPIAYAYDIIDA